MEEVPSSTSAAVTTTTATASTTPLTTTQTPTSPNPKPKFSLPQRPPIRLTSEYDTDTNVFLNKISCKLFDSFAKLKFSFQNNNKTREISDPQIGLITKNLSIFYDVEEQNTFVKGSFAVLGDQLQFRVAHDVKAQEGEVAMVANLSDPSYKLELSSAVPSIGLPKATVTFPLGEVSLEAKPEEEMNRILSLSGILKGQVLNGMCIAQYKDEDLNLRYSYKDEEMTFIPRISLPSNSASFAFKRRLSASDKLSYWYNFDADTWSTVYKHKVGKDIKVKAGYDSDVRLGWASLWVGDENGKAKTAPMKTKVQLMLQVPQDDIKSSVVLLRLKKRWDF